MNKDQVKGRVDEVVGKVKEVAGKTVGNERLEGEGLAERGRAARLGGLSGRPVRADLAGER